MIHTSYLACPREKKVQKKKKRYQYGLRQNENYSLASPRGVSWRTKKSEPLESNTSCIKFIDCEGGQLGLLPSFKALHYQKRIRSSSCCYKVCV